MEVEELERIKERTAILTRRGRSTISLDQIRQTVEDLEALIREVEACACDMSEAS